MTDRHATDCRCWMCDSARALDRIKAAAPKASTTTTIHVGGGSAPTRRSRRTAR